MCIVDVGDVTWRRHGDPVLHAHMKSKPVQTLPDSSDLANDNPDIPASHGPENSVTTDLLNMTRTQNKWLRDAALRGTERLQRS
jgi:hypothetical protein